MELKELVTLFRRWIWLLIAGLLIGLAFGLLVSQIQPPVYEATTKVLVARNRQQGGADILSLSDQQLVATYEQLLTTQPIIDEAASRAGTKVDPKNVQADIILNTQIIQIKVQNRDARTAAAVANAMAGILIEQNETLQAGRYAAYEDGLNSQIAQVQQQTADLQDQIRHLDQTNVADQLAQVNKQITSLQGEILTLENEIAQSPEPTGSAARASLAEKQAQAEQLRTLLFLYQQIQTNLSYIGKPSEIADVQPDPQLASLQSALSLYQQLYLNLLNNREAVKQARFQSTPTVTQIEQAAPPKNPIRPQPLLYTALAGIVGIILMGVAILLIDYFDDSVKSQQQARELLQIPVIGQIPMLQERRKWYRPVVRPPLPDSVLDNLFSALRVNLTRLMAAKSQKVLLVTSPGRGEGKTTVAVNLAKAFARAGKKTILVDADFRHPEIHTRLGLENHMGLADILTAGMDWQEVTCQADGQTVLTSGTKAAASDDLLESDKMADLLDRLQRKADVVIVDTAPLYLVQSQVLASRAGGVLLVIQQGQTSAAVVRSLKAQLDLMDITLMGVVVSGVPQDETYYYEASHAEDHQKPEKAQEVQAA